MAGVSGCSGCRELNQQIRELEQRIRALEGRNKALQEQVDSLAAALEESRRAGKRQAAPFSKGAPKARPNKPGRKPGKDYGKAARRAIPDRVDEELRAPLPSCCPDCQGRVVLDRVAEQYQTEIPRPRAWVRRFDVDVGHCVECGRRVQGRHPAQTSDALGAAASQVGPDLVALAAYMHQEQGIPIKKVCDVLAEIYGIQISVGGLSQALARLARRAEPTFDRLLEEVRQSEAVYPDETSARMNGQRWWLWVFTTALTTVYVQRPSRGFDVIEEVLGPDYAGLVGHDGWAPYDKLTEATHQQCLAHLIRRARELLETANRGAVRFPRKVKKLLQDALALRDRWEAGELSEHGFRVARGRLEKRLERALAMRITHPGNQKFQAHLARHEDELLTFLYEDVEATNWRAEQAIRPAVRFRKTSGGHRSPAGARTRDVLLSIFRTVRQRGANPLSFLSGLLRQRSREAVPIPAAPDP